MLSRVDIIVATGFVIICWKSFQTTSYSWIWNSEGNGWIDKQKQHNGWCLLWWFQWTCRQIESPDGISRCGNTNHSNEILSKIEENYMRARLYIELTQVKHHSWPMYLNIFGRGRSEPENIRSLASFLSKLTRDEQYDIPNRKLCNVSDPVETGDAVTWRRLQKVSKTFNTEYTKKLLSSSNSSWKTQYKNRDSWDTFEWAHQRGFSRTKE